MSLQDEIFDIQDALKGTKVDKSFDVVLRYINDLEEENESVKEANKDLRTTLRTLVYEIKQLDIKFKKLS